MAERRMFAKTIVLSDAFLDMPLGARCLYMTMGMLADDDGFVNSPKSIMRQTGATEDDLRILIAKKFIIPFESGVIVIKHWRINNYLQSDRYKQTVYQEEKAMLTLDDKGSYTNVYTSDVYTGKDRIGKDSIGNKRVKAFTPPTLAEVESYCQERGNTVSAKRFFDYYEANDWKDGKGNKVKNWKQKVISWERSTDGRITYEKPNVVEMTTDEMADLRKRMMEDADVSKLH